MVSSSGRSLKRKQAPLLLSAVLPLCILVGAVGGVIHLFPVTDKTLFFRRKNALFPEEHFYCFMVLGIRLRDLHLPVVLSLSHIPALRTFLFRQPQGYCGEQNKSPSAFQTPVSTWPYVEREALWMWLRDLWLEMIVNYHGGPTESEESLKLRKEVKEEQERAGAIEEVVTCDKSQIQITGFKHGGRKPWMQRPQESTSHQGRQKRSPVITEVRHREAGMGPGLSEQHDNQCVSF